MRLDEVGFFGVENVEQALRVVFQARRACGEEDRWSIPTTAAKRHDAITLRPLKGRIRVPLKGNGSFSFDIVGEASYQDVLGEIAGKKTREGKELRCTTTVALEPTNPHDSNAVAVEIDGKKVGYLSKADAKDYASQLKEIGGGNYNVAAMIVGGFKSKTREGHFGVKLDVTRHS